VSGVRLELRNVRFGYADWGVSFDLDVPPGAFVAVIGPSGAGKSTLLSLIAGFEMPASGEIAFDGSVANRLPPDQRPVTMLFQENNLFAHLDVFTNVGLGVSPAMKLDARQRESVMQAVARVGLQGKEKRLPGALSGGERQRAALARALVRDKPVLLLDEPFAALGPALKADMLALVADMHRERQMTVLMVTHHPEDARQAAGFTAFLDAGRVVAMDETGRLFADRDVAGLDAYLGRERH
jgi:thiamine transport system ATP-binding protein